MMTIKIVIADDHQVVRDGLVAVLAEESDFEIVGLASDGLDAIKTVEKLKPDVLVIDITMPQLNGIDATKRILAIAPDLRILCLSMHNESRLVIEMLRVGCTGFIHKDSAFDVLADAIRTVYDGNTYIGQNINTKEVSHYLKNPDAYTDNMTASILTSREREIVQLVAEGKSSKEIARLLHISPYTVTTHRQRISEKLEISGTADLTRYAIREGLIDS